MDSSSSMIRMVAVVRDAPVHPYEDGIPWCGYGCSSLHRYAATRAYNKTRFVKLMAEVQKWTKGASDQAFNP